MSEEKKYDNLTLQEATDFFSEFYYGEHRIPSKIKECGEGFSVQHHGSLSTYDYNNMTRLVIMCHDRCIRAEIMPSSFGNIKIGIWKRQGREGKIWDRHPTLEEAIESAREGIESYAVNNKPKNI